MNLHFLNTESGVYWLSGLFIGLAVGVLGTAVLLRLVMDAAATRLAKTLCRHCCRNATDTPDAAKETATDAANSKQGAI